MKTIPLGRSGTEVSALCLGAMYFGTTTDQATSFQLLDLYTEAGGSFIDTANIYCRWVEGFNGGESETLLGKWMRERGNRERLFLATKVGFQYPGVERGLKARQIEEECDKSLQRLQVDRIDLYYAHVDDMGTPMEESLEAFHRLHRAGKVRILGASNFTAWRLEESRWTSLTQDRPAYSCVQQRYTYLRPRAGATFAPQLSAEPDLIDYCGKRGLTLLAYSPLLRGAYSRPDRALPSQYQGEDSNRRLETLRTMAADLGCSPNQLVLAWMHHHAAPVIPLVAASRPEHLRENLASLEIRLIPEQIAALDAA